MPSTETMSQTIARSDREDRRPADLTGWLVRAGHEDAHDFVMDNLSYGGCRVQSSANIDRGDLVHLTVVRRGAIPATVRWRNAHGIGLAFSTDAPKDEKPRKAERLPLQAEISVRQAGRRPRTVEANDLSRHGCCVTLDDLPFVGEWVWVTLPGLVPVESRVRWIDVRRAGIEFVHPVHDSVFDLLLLRLGLKG